MCNECQAKEDQEEGFFEYVLTGESTRRLRVASKALTIKGTSLGQDTRFSDKEMRELKKTKFPADFDEKVDPSKVKLEHIKKWVQKRVTDLTNLEDEFLINYIMAMLEEPVR